MAIIKHSSLRLRGPAQPGDITSDLAGSGGGVTLAQAVLGEFGGAGNTFAPGGEGNVDLVIKAGDVNSMLTSENIADFLEVDDADKARFVRDCLVFATLQIFTDEVVTVGARGVIEIDNAPQGQPVAVEIGENTSPIGPVFVWRPSPGDALSVFFNNFDADPNVFYPDLRVWFIG